MAQQGQPDRYPPGSNQTNQEKPSHQGSNPREQTLQDTQLSQISNFIWGVADDLLDYAYVRGKYRDVILSMTVLRTYTEITDQEPKPGRQ